MNPISRRDFMFLSSGAALGNMVVPGLANAGEESAHELDFSASGLVTGQPKPLKLNSVPGFLSAEQIAPHHAAHYGGALKGYTAADARLEESVKGEKSLDPAAFGALKRAVNSKGNSVVPHEMYFDAFGSVGGCALRSKIGLKFLWFLELTANEALLQTVANSFIELRTIVVPGPLK